MPRCGGFAIGDPVFFFRVPSRRTRGRNVAQPRRDHQRSGAGDFFIGAGRFFCSGAVNFLQWCEKIFLVVGDLLRKRKLKSPVLKMLA